MTVVLLVLAALLVYMTLAFGVARKLDRLDVVDTAWGGGFLVVASVALAYQRHGRVALVWLLVLVWAFRLASHIWRRNQFKGPDPRYDALSAKWGNRSFWARAYVSIFLTQAALIFVVGLPVSVNALRSGPANGSLVVLGALLWLAGLVFEAIADKQLSDFIKSKPAKGAVLDAGLWRYSRHPNYFGELLCWWGIAVIAVTAPYGWIGLAGPAVLSYLIIFVSGLPSVEKRRAGNPQYQAYKRRTSALIPLPPRKL